MNPTDQFLQGALAAMIAADTQLEATKCFVGLSLARPGRGQLSTMADIQVPGGTLGVTKVVATWTAPYKDGSGLWIVDGPVLRWTPVAGDPQIVATTWYLADALTAGNLLAFGPVNPARALVDASTSLSLVPRLSLDPASRWAPSVMIGS